MTTILVTAAGAPGAAPGWRARPSRQARKPPSIWATLARPMSFNVLVASAERWPAAQNST